MNVKDLNGDHLGVRIRVFDSNGEIVLRGRVTGVAHTSWVEGRVFGGDVDVIPDGVTVSVVGGHTDLPYYQGYTFEVDE